MSHLQAGDPAPQFRGKDQNGHELSLDAFRGKTLVLYFYPKDDTPGCTKEACSFRDNYASLLSEDIAVVGVSADSEKSHLKFSGKFNLPFPLLADPDRRIIAAYGAWGEKTLFGRHYPGILRRTFIIDGNGLIRNVIEKVDTGNASAQVLELLQQKQNND